MKSPTIITCAVTGGGDTASKNPAVPVRPDDIARSAIEAADRGAAIVHVHVRDPETTCGSMEFSLYARVVEILRNERPRLIINLTTGAGALMSAAQIRDGSGAQLLRSPGERVAHVEKLRPELCSLDMATMNFGDRMFINSVADISEMAALIAGTGAKPELEAFDYGQMRLIAYLIERGVLGPKPMVQICLGILGGAAADAETMVGMARLLPPGAVWAGFGLGPQNFPMVAQSVILGGHVRVGLEDALHIERGVLAPSNAALVAKAVDLIGLLGRRPAAPDEAREILGLAPLE